MTWQTVTALRRAVLELLRSPWTALWLATPALQAEALRPLLPHLNQEGRTVRILTDLSHEAILDGRVELAALHRLRELQGCEIRGLTGLSAALWAVEGGPALVSTSPLTLEGLDGLRNYGVQLDEGGSVASDLASWWESAQQLSPVEWSALSDRVGRRQEAQRVGAEIARLGAFVRVSTRGTRRSRKLDPRDYGVAGISGGRLRPMDLLLYRLDPVTRAKEELDGILAEHGLEWNGQYLVPRRFLEQEWPATFAARQRQLSEALHSPENRTMVTEQIQQARRDLEGFFGELYPWIESEGVAAELWVESQTSRLLSDAAIDRVLDEGGLEYRVLTIMPEDSRSLEELNLLLQDPKLRSVQLTFPV